MTTAILGSCQPARITDTTASKPKPHTQPLELARRLLIQLEQDLRTGDQLRARLVNSALLELQTLLPAHEARLIDRGIDDAWRRACGWSF